MSVRKRLQGTEERTKEEEEGCCRMVAAYEDFGCGIYAKEACEGLAQAVSRDVECRWDLWRFDLLGSCREAFDEARRAHVLVVSLTGRRPVPEDVRAWLEEVTMVKQWEERALVGLFRADSRNMLRLPAYRSLEEIADRTRLAFFAQTFQISRATKPEESRESPRVQDLLRRTLHTSRTVREWGINE